MAAQIHTRVSLMVPSWEGNGTLDRRPECSHHRHNRPRDATPKERPLDTLPRWPPASGSVDCTVYNTPPEDLSACSLNQEDPFE